MEVNGIIINPTFPIAFGMAVPYYDKAIQRSIEKADDGMPDEDTLVIPWEHATYEEAYYTILSRYDSAVEYERKYRESYSRLKFMFHDQEELAIQNNAMYGFFTNACSCFESFCYMMFKLGKLLFPNKSRFMIEEKRIDPSSTWKAFKDVFPEDHVTASLKRMLKSDAYRELNFIRNVLSHRATPKRVRQTDLDGIESEIVRFNAATLEIDVLTETTLLNWLQWLTEERDVLVVDCVTFIRTHFDTFKIMNKGDRVWHREKKIWGTIDFFETEEGERHYDFNYLSHREGLSKHESVNIMPEDVSYKEEK